MEELNQARTYQSNIQRNSNLELLRIISILFIIFSHYCFYGPLSWPENNFLIEQPIFDCIRSFGKIGVNCFVLISGYFLCTSKIKFRKIFLLIFEMTFYSVSIYLFLTLFKVINFSGIELFKQFFAIFWPNYGFFVSYLMMYLFSPLLNIIIKQVSSKKLLGIILLGLLIYSIIPTLTTTDFLYYNDGIWFMIVYLISAFIRFNQDQLRFNSKKFNIILLIISLTSLFCSIFIIYFLSFKVDILKNHINYFAGSNSIISLLVSISIFNLFRFFKFQSKAINYLAKSTFGVYLIHEYPLFRTTLWQTICHANSMIFSHWVIIHMIACCTIIYLVCTAIDSIRRLIFEVPIIYSINKISNLIYIEKIGDTIMRFLSKK